MTAQAKRQYLSIMNKTDVKGYLLQLVDPTGGHWVAQLLGAAIAAASTFIMPVKGFLLLIGALVVADLYTGWRKSRKVSGAKLSSQGVGRTIEKSVMYLVAMLVGRGVDNEFAFEGLLSVAYLVGSLIIGRETLSIFENVDAVLGTDFTGKITAAFEFLRKAKKDAPTDPPAAPPV